MSSNGFTNNITFYKQLAKALAKYGRVFTKYRFEYYHNHIKLIPSDIVLEDKQLECFLEKYFEYNLTLEDWREVDESDEAYRQRKSTGYFVCFDLNILKIKKKNTDIKKIVNFVGGK